MKNHSNSEKLINIKNNKIFTSLTDNSFYSLDLEFSNKKIMNKKRNRDKTKFLIDKINTIELNQNLANNKLDIIISLLKSKLLGKNDFEIFHYDLCLIQNKKKEEQKEKINKKEEIDIKEDNDININDEFEFERISKIKKTHFNRNNLDRKMLFDENNNKNVNNISSGNDNLKEMINDFLNQNHDEKIINEKKEENIEKNKSHNEKENNDNNTNNIKENTNENINNKTEDKHEIKDENIVINKENHLIINNDNKSLMNNIDLNKYKIETNEENKEEKEEMNNNIDKIIDFGINNINEIINKENNNINSNFLKMKKEDLQEDIKNSDKDKLENININKEINNMEKNENNLNNSKGKE